MKLRIGTGRIPVSLARVGGGPVIPPDPAPPYYRARRQITVYRAPLVAHTYDVPRKVTVFRVGRRRRTYEAG